MKYFHYSQGLRGCYLPNSASVVACRTRRALCRLFNLKEER